MARSLNLSALPTVVQDALTHLGRDVRRARIRRRIPMEDMAAKCVMSVPTLRKVEQGDPSVGLAPLAAALWAMGMEQRLAMLLREDVIGESLEARRRPKTARREEVAAGNF
jgi:transcriptional regulator with XRE-family HTH domain